MRTFLLSVLTVFCISVSFAQTSKLKNKKYQSLLWEITGKGLSKPSYLFGTMHVSSKLAFHLSDSFYLALKNADVVALETNPADWQEDFSRYEMNPTYYSQYYGRNNSNADLDDYMSINSLKAVPYEKLLERALSNNSAIINNFLYRTNSAAASDFEEDTYLDLYIFQVGKKWNKKVCSVENFDKSMQLMKEAYADAMKDKKNKERSYDNDNEFSYNKLEEAYRTGNLDLLDTITKINTSSEAFTEKFLYKRNDIQAASIDSILKSKASLFVGVGAAHLPGERGVIELLRTMGYRLRPMKMTERDSKHKDDIEKIRVSVPFSKQTSPDGFFSANLPGKLYSYSSPFSMTDECQFADMANGSYYMVSRVYTNAALWGHSPEIVQRKVDSILYENIPGKIISNKPIVKNGYKGFDILNRTRRGDCQRYNIFITPFEVLVFKMSGNGDYVKSGKEADDFFNSIELKENKQAWKKISPDFGGFEVEMPHRPFLNNTESGFRFMAYDKQSATNFEVIRTAVYNTNFVEEDSFDLCLMEESFGASGFIEKQISRKQTNSNGYAALEAKYRYKDGSVALAKFVIQGPYYYTLITNAKAENAGMTQFLNSFTLKPFAYKESQNQTDTGLYYTVFSPVTIEKQGKLEIVPRGFYNRYTDNEESLPGEEAINKSKIIVSDSTGEKIIVSFFKPSRYYNFKDSANTDTTHFETNIQSWIFRKRTEHKIADNIRMLEYELGDSVSSRIVKGKYIYKNGISYRIETEGDTLTKWSSFITGFFSTFNPVDTIKSLNAGEKKTNLLFADFFSNDTLLHKMAVRNIYMIKPDSSDFGLLKKAIESLNWKEKKYLDVKNRFIYRLSCIKSKESSDYLKKLYYAAGDTVDMQNTILETLLAQSTNYSFGQFRDIMLNEPPVLDYGSKSDNEYSDRDFLEGLEDSLQLTRTIFKDLLPLININDYEQPVMNLLTTMVDSNLIAAKDYEIYLPKFLIEAKQELKKQLISEKSKAINEAQYADQKKNNYDRGNTDRGNRTLSSYATLLMPFWQTNASVPQLYRQILNCTDKRLKYNTAILLLRNEKDLPDTMLKYFARLDEYRYKLYDDLKEMNKLKLMPAAYNNHIELAKSKLMDECTNDVPDSMVYIERLPLLYNNCNGFVYFFKFRQKKDDNFWKIAMTGLIPTDPVAFEFESPKDMDLTEMTSTKIDADTPLKEQLEKVLKKALFSKRKSGTKFYIGENAYNQFSISSVYED